MFRAVVGFIAIVVTFKVEFQCSLACLEDSSERALRNNR